MEAEEVLRCGKCVPVSLLQAQNFCLSFFIFQLIVYRARVLNNEHKFVKIGRSEMELFFHVKTTHLEHKLLKR
jgi:hypothetical protein